MNSENAQKKHIRSRLLPSGDLPFTTNLLRVFLLSLMVVVILLLILTLYLTDYQKSLPRDSADRILKGYLEADAGKFQAIQGSLPNAFSADENLRAYMDTCFPSDDIYYYRTGSDNPDETVFEFAAGDTPIGTLTTRDTHKNSLFGFPKHEPVSYVPHPIYSYRVTAPTGLKLLMDGRPLEDMVQCEHDYPSAGFKTIALLSSAVPNPLMRDVYILPDFQCTGALTVDIVTGYTVITDDESHSAVVVPEQPYEKQAQVQAFAEEYSRLYMVFATKKYGDRNPVLARTLKGTELYDAIRIYGNEWGKEFVSDSIENFNVDNVMMYSENEYSCHVTLTYVITRADGVIKNIDFDATYYMSDRTGAWLMADMVY